jgi:hypothetical protein
VAVIAWLYVDHIQSTLCVVCLGILSGRQTRTIGDARLWSLILFLTLQIGWYLLLILSAMLLVIILMRIPGIPPWISLMLTPWMVVGLSLGGREALLQFLWRRVLLMTNAQSNDLNLLRPYYYTTQRLMS